MKRKVILKKTPDSPFLTGSYSLYDKEIGMYNIPFYAENALGAEAVIRQQIINNPEHYLVFDGDRFLLVQIGFLDMRSGEFHPDLQVVKPVEEIVPHESFVACLRWKQNVVKNGDVNHTVTEIVRGVADKVEEDDDEKV